MVIDVDFQQDGVSISDREFNCDFCPVPLVFLESGGMEEVLNTSYYNRPEGLRIISILEDLLMAGVYPEDIGIVSVLVQLHKF